MSGCDICSLCERLVSSPGGVFSRGALWLRPYIMPPDRVYVRVVVFSSVPNLGFVLSACAIAPRPPRCAVGPGRRCANIW